MAYDIHNSGVLFKEREKKSDKSPDMTGKINVDGKEYKIAAWKREGKDGNPFLSLKISDPAEFARSQRDKPAPAKQPSGPDPDDKLPW